MTMRLSGLISGMDTESIIKELCAAKQVKKDKAVKSKTKMEWKQEAWKGLNTKLKNFQTKYANTMRWSTAYMKKTTKVSNPNAVSVITGENAMNGVQRMTVESLAKTAYMTGGNLKELHTTTVDGVTTVPEDYTALTKLSDVLGEGVDFRYGATLHINVGTAEPVDVELKADATISDFLNGLKDAGLNANFDATQQRFYISAKESGAEGNFSFSVEQKLTPPESEEGDPLPTLTADAAFSAKFLSGLGVDDANGKRVTGQDAVITLNEVRYTSKSNTFSINGLTITAMAETSEAISVTTQDDTDGIYDMIKGFFKEYNALVNEMDKLYNADSADKFDPLTDEEKDEMSDSEIEKWETKIKDAILRRDDSLYSVNSGMQDVMSQGFEIDGKTYYLSDFGIATGGYFITADNEKHAYHIDGDADDTLTSGNADKLKGLIASDPNLVASFFSKLSNEVYQKMDSLSSSIEGYRSYGTFYNDKKMKADLNSQESKISDLEKMLADYEDKWYAKFASMETAMAKLQNNTNALTNMLGG